MLLAQTLAKACHQLIFNYWFEKYNIDAEYGIKKLKRENFDKEIELIKRKSCRALRD